MFQLSFPASISISAGENILLFLQVKSGKSLKPQWFRWFDTGNFSILLKSLHFAAPLQGGLVSNIQLIIYNYHKQNHYATNLGIYEGPCEGEVPV